MRSLLLPPVVLNFTDPPASTPLVVASGIPVAALRQAARQLRGTTSFALEQGTTPSLQLWRWELEKQVVNYDGDVAATSKWLFLWCFLRFCSEGCKAPHLREMSIGGTLRELYGTVLNAGCVHGEVTNLNPSYLEHFARIHSQPLLQNYSWTLKDQLDGIGMPIGVLWVNHRLLNSLFERRFCMDFWDGSVHSPFPDPWPCEQYLNGIEVNYSDSNNSNTTTRALTAFSNLCKKRRGTNSSRHILCCVMDQSNAYHQRDYGTLVMD